MNLEPFFTIIIVSCLVGLFGMVVSLVIVSVNHHIGGPYNRKKHKP